MAGAWVFFSVAALLSIVTSGAYTCFWPLVFSFHATDGPHSACISCAILLSNAYNAVCMNLMNHDSTILQKMSLMT